MKYEKINYPHLDENNNSVTSLVKFKCNFPLHLILDIYDERNFSLKHKHSRKHL